MIAGGNVRAGQRVPSTCSLAQELEISHVTQLGVPPQGGTTSGRLLLPARYCAGLLIRYTCAHGARVAEWHTQRT